MFSKGGPTGHRSMRGARSPITFALRDEWTGHGLGRQGRIAGGYGALIKFLVSEARCMKRDTKIWPSETGHQNPTSLVSFQTRRPN
jgi:hypothetical protein